MSGGTKVRVGVTLAVVVAVLLPALASATTRHVTTTKDKGSGSLRQKIKHAKAGDTVAVPKGDYELHKGEIKLGVGLKVEGAGAERTIIDGGGNDRVFEVTDGVGPVGISGLTITGGHANPGGGILNTGTLNLSRMTIRGNVAAGTTFNSGGGIANGGALNLRRVTMRGNRTSSTEEGFGGAIALGVSPLSQTGSVTIDRSRLTANRAPSDGFGGAIAAQPTNYPGDVVLKITRTRIDHNKATSGGNFAGTGGGIFFNPLIGPPINYAFTLRDSTLDHNAAGKPGLRGFGGGIDAAPDAMAMGASSIVTIENSTVTLNRAFDASNSLGGGVYLDTSGSGGGSALAVVGSSTIAGNTAGVGGGIYATTPGVIGDSIVASNTADTGKDCEGTLNGFGFNLESATTCGFASPGDLQGAAPKLGKLKENGGPTPTLALGKNSPARNAGDDPSCTHRDQRGVTRPQGPHCDIGAFEFRKTKNP